MKYPEKFTVKSNWKDWEVTYNHSTGSYDWKSDCGFTYELDEGSVSHLEEQVDIFEFISPEPELVFPFSYVHREGNAGIVRVEKTEDGLQFSLHEGYKGYNVWDEEQIKQFIKEGIWIVKAVGQEALAMPSYSAQYYEGDVSHAEAVDELVEPSEAVVEDAISLKIKVDAQAATAAMKEFCAAVEETNVALEKFHVTMERMWGMFGGEVRMECFDPTILTDFSTYKE